MRPTPEAVIALASKILDLKRQLAEAEGQWDALFPEDGPSSATLNAAPVIRQKVGSRGGVLKSSSAGKMLLYIDLSGSKDLHPTQIAQATGIPLDTVRSNLSRLLDKGLIERRGPRGFYGAKTTKEKEVTEATS